MPGKVKVKIISGRNLPVMDRSSDTTDAYVEIKLGSTTYKTDVCRKSLHPMWNSDWYRFEVDDSELQDEPLQIRLMDHDTYSANDAIGKVYLDLNPLLLPQTSLLLKWNEGSGAHETPSNSVMSGWIPVYDTMHGIRGEVNIIVKVELFSDFNKFRQSSCGVQFFCSAVIPHGYFAQVVHGFVEELVVNDDPEYQWIDKIRTPRASNEARQTLFFKLSGELQRKIGVKALDLGGNAVIGYSQSFDLEGESGIVARGIGTAVTLIKMNDTPTQMNVDNNIIEERTQNYLNFLGAAKGFYLKNNLLSLNKIPIPLPKPSPTPSIKSLKLDESMFIHDHPNSHISRHLSDREFNTILRPPTEMIHHCASLQTLLKQEDMRGTPGHGISQRIKNLKYSSQNMLSKTMIQLKAKLSDSNVPENQVMPEKKSRHNFKYRRTQSDSTGMAEILVKSVFNATASLEQIAETPTSIKQQSCFNDNEVESTNRLDPLLLSVPNTSLDSQSLHASSSSSDSSSIEDDDDDDDDDVSETNCMELDTVSHIVETVRKQSMIVPISTDFDFHLNNTKNRFDGINLIHATALNIENYKSEDELNNSDTIQNDDSSNVDTISNVTNISEEKTFFLSKNNSKNNINILSKHKSYEDLYKFNINSILADDLLAPPKVIKKNSSSVSLTDLENLGANLTTKFTSLHNIHKSSCKMNKYSNHEGKETVLGHLFKQIDMPTFSNDLEFQSNHKFLDHLKEGKNKIIHAPKAFLHKFDSKMHHKKESHNDGLLQTALGNVLMESVNDILATSHSEKRQSFFEQPSLNNICQSIPNTKLVTPESPKSLHSYLKEEKCVKPKKLFRFYSHFDNLKNDSPDLKSSLDNIFKYPKVLYQRLDSKIHKKRETVKGNGLLNAALENVLMDSVNEVLATSHSETSKQTNLSQPDDDAFKNESRAQHCEEFLGLANKHHNDEPVINDIEIKSGKQCFFKDRKNKFCRASKIFFQRLNSKIHKDSNESKDIENDEGLLSRALGNVLMESVNDILVTSHPNSSNDPNPTSLNSNMTNVKFPNTDPSTVAANLEIDAGNRDSINTMHACLTPIRVVETPIPEIRTEPPGHQRTESFGTRISHSPAKLNSIPCIHRRSSDSDLSITPKGFLRKRNSLTGSDRSGGCSSGHFMRASIVRSTLPSDNFDIMEYPFLTMSKYPPGFVTFIGGAVSARSVKLLERITNLEEPESRDTWWSEIRMEIRSHARALNCNAVLGYIENTSICDDVCVLSASGTAAVIGHQYAGELNDNVSGLPVIPKPLHNKDMMTTSLDRNDFEKDRPIKIENIVSNKPVPPSSPDRDTSLKQACNICHLPYMTNSVPLRKSSSKCLICRNGKVPDVLIATIEIPDGIPSQGRGCFVQSYVFRHLRDLKGESNAKEISDGLPFLEYELHRLLINKLKVKGMNAVFGLKVRISVGERMLVGIATGTAVYLTPLPSPPLPKLVSDRTTDEKKLLQLQKSLHETVKKNREIYQLTNDETANGKTLSDTDDSEEEQSSFDYSIGNKDCCILEVDDQEDVDVLNSIMESRPPDGFHVVNTELVPGLDDLEIVKNLQMFIQVWRAKIQPPYSLDKHFERLLQSVYFKLRRMIPCALCDLQFRVDAPEPDEIQLCVLGMALGLGDPQKIRNKRKNLLHKRNDEELIFNLEEDQIPEHGVLNATSYLQTQNLKHRQKSPIRNRLNARQRHIPYRERHGVDITPLSYVPGGKIEKYLGNLNFFLIRETTSIREEGGLSGFMHSFITEILAIVRAHVTALGGNAMVAYFLTECVLNHNLHKNQGQCLINVGGDVVHVSYYPEDH